MLQFIYIPIVGTFILLVIIYFLFKISDIDIKDVLTYDGFMKTYNESPWIIYTTIVITLYVSYSIWTNYYQIESFDSNISKHVNATSFDDFYKNYVMNIDFSDINTPNKYRNLTLKQNRINSRNLVFRTTIDGIRYYLIVGDLLRNISPHRKNHFSPNKQIIDGHICSNNASPEKLVKPELIREDILAQRYRVYIRELDNAVKKQIRDRITDLTKKLQENISSAEKEKILNILNDPDTTKTNAEKFLGRTMFPRFPHHIRVRKSINSQQNDPTYYISGITLSQAFDFGNLSSHDYLLSAYKSFSPNIDVLLKQSSENNTQKIQDDKMFMCAVQPPRRIPQKDTFIRTESSISNPTNDNNMISSNTDQTILLRGKNNMTSSYTKNGTKLYIYGTVTNQKTGRKTNNVKFYLSRLGMTTDPMENTSDKYDPYYHKPIRYPIVIVPHDYSGGIYKDGINYKYAIPIEFNVAMVQLEPI